ncbi:MAG: hypothetical protein R3331_06610 [Sulfurospirillaceae bacterium]|nr:hypothetical protein [Sulfurospirillaceae bacterium]
MIGILTDILKLSKEYSDNNGADSIDAFIEWLCHRNKLQKPTKKISNSSLVFALNRSNSKMRDMSRKVLKSCNLNSVDDYFYLQELKKHKILSKSVLINSFDHEISKGSEIIKRLVKSSFLIESTDAKDKRVKLIELTPLALSALGVLENQLTQIYDKKFESYHDGDKELFLKLLKKI